ncbi:MAG: DUF3365 domain-containing protein [Novipirellula sp. JB048]
MRTCTGREPAPVRFDKTLVRCRLVRCRFTPAPSRPPPPSAKVSDMNYRNPCLGLLVIAAISLLSLPVEGVSPASPGDAASPDTTSTPASEPDATSEDAETVTPPASLSEARARAKLLHETIHGTLQVVHRDFFDEEEAHAIPSASLEDVFHELTIQYGIELKWLIIDTDIINVDHQPSDDFERAALQALKAKRPYHEKLEQDRYRFAGPIRLASQCLKCHVKHRTSTADRTAGLLISLPVSIAP